MATTGFGQFTSRASLPTFGNFGNTMLERSNPGLRKSTPDSEALASSDEEVEQSRMRSVTSRKALPNRRSSLLGDQGPDASRRLSFAGSSSFSPVTGSQPNTPGASHDNWSTISPSASTWNTGSAYPFGSNIWGANSRDPPTRLQEVRQDNMEGRLPFAIPSQPNPSVQRSMSFSVGQTEYNPAMTTTIMETTSRPGPGLTRRSSRPSNLGHEYGGLSIVNENEDTDRYFTGGASSVQLNRGQTRAMSNVSAHTMSSTFRAGRLRNPPHEAPELAIDDMDEPTTQFRYPIRNAPTRRLSDFQAVIPSRQPNPPPFSSVNSSNIRSNPHWSSNLDFGQLDTIPQSRRHSFADVPTRRGSMGSNEEDDNSIGHDAGSQGLSQDHDASYFHRNDITRRVTEQEVQHQLQQEHHQAIFGTASPYGIHTSASAIGSFQGPNPTPLYVVNFKCCRSEIFYIQEGTGLSVKDGDLVIVEADRGTDLGSVQHSRVSWEAARKYKANYAEQHFAWLMMFSQQTRSGAPNLFNPNAVTSNRNGGSSQGGAVRDSDLKPKMIKRLAQPHEVQALQEKEGNEAKAKRICQQKVVEHGLSMMEILDAEFQMDGKKLTFYFFSNEYINFNALVTDLFKMYKTRIWMSAINPASFQSPVSSLGITPLYGNAGLGVTNAPQAANTYDEQRDETRYTQQTQQVTPQRAMPPLYYGGYGQGPQVNGYAAYTAHFQQPVMDPFSGYNAPQAYGVHNSRPQNMPVNRSGPTARHYQTSPSAGGLAGQFNSLSLGR